jgi:DNA repair exonuclease SbcCD ATPase subunit
MRIVQLQAENFKRLQAVEITPEGHLITIGGKNGSGKSSVLDAIYVALVGRSAAPPRPIRTGEEECIIRLDLGELRVVRRFTTKDGGEFTDSLKVENAEGLRYGKPQQVLDALLGEIGFDPFEFCQMKPAAQAETLLGMVPLSVDLDEMAEQDQSDYMKRRDLNRDLANAKSLLASIPKQDVPENLPDRKALQDQLAKAAETNSEIERERAARESLQMRIDTNRQRAKELQKEIEAIEARAAEDEKVLAAKPVFGDPVDVGAIRAQLTEAEAILTAAAQQRVRASHAERVENLEKESQALTDAMEAREKERRDALAGAKMPIEGLGFQIDEKGKPLVTFAGVPFEQASTAEQLRASTAIAMAANPSLRVLRVKDGSLLDEDSMKLLAEMATEQDFQLWVERVGSGDVGVVMENGEVKAAPKKAATKAKAAEPETAKPEGTLV